MKNHPLIKSLLALRGNPKYCIFTEPLWGIPNQLYAPFATVYMSALLLTDRQIGLVASVSMFFQAVSALVSGAITDKLGRRKTTVIFDLIAWSIPALLWAFSQNFWWFITAAALNGLWQVTNNSWMCLLVEDAEKSSIADIFSFLHITGQLAVVFAPFSGLLVNRLGIVATMRIIYLFTFVSMTAKFVILYFYSTETGIGETRMKETGGMSLFAVMSGYGAILRRILSSADMRLALVVSATLSIASLIMGNFFGLLTTHDLMVPQHFLAYFPILRSIIILVFMFGIQSGLSRFGYKGPMLAGGGFYFASHIVLILSPRGNLIVPFVYIFLEACAHALVMPRRDSIMILLVDPAERARIFSIMTVLVLAVNIPFGYFAGWLSEIDRRLPFGLDIAIFVLVFFIIAGSKRLSAGNLDAADSEAVT
ncbi:MAG: MFS transporter [Oscillospiraceae bacterium]|nr:MFS transporter [Oscillospiraceae bacterium]